MDKQILANHVISTVTTSKGFIGCMDQCLSTAGCKSVNLEFDCMRCHMNNATHCSHPRDMVYVQANVAYSINYKYIDGE